MTKKIRKMQRKMQPSDNVDDELEELLENCVSQLESERALTFKLKEELYNCQRMIKDLTVRMKEPKSMRSIEDEKS